MATFPFMASDVYLMPELPTQCLDLEGRVMHACLIEAHMVWLLIRGGWVHYIITHGIPRQVSGAQQSAHSL